MRLEWGLTWPRACSVNKHRALLKKVLFNTLSMNENVWPESFLMVFPVLLCSIFVLWIFLLRRNNFSILWVVLVLFLGLFQGVGSEESWQIWLNRSLKSYLRYIGSVMWSWNGRRMFFIKRRIFCQKHNLKPLCKTEYSKWFFYKCKTE